MGTKKNLDTVRFWPYRWGMEKKSFEFTAPRVDKLFGGWSREVTVDGKSVGYKWEGWVLAKGGGGYIYSGDVPKSIGCRGLLLAAGLIKSTVEASNA